MGCVLSQPVMATDATTAEVEKQLQEAQDKEQYQFKILLLGAGESGKSTVVKQVKLIYKGVVTAKEKEEYTHAIRRNVIDSMQTMLDAMDSFDIALARPGSAEAAQRVRAVDAEATLEESLARDVTALWADEGMRATYDRRDEFWLLDASVYVADAEATLEEFLARDVTALWADEGVRATCDRRDEFWLLDARCLRVSACAGCPCARVRGACAASLLAQRCVAARRKMHARAQRATVAVR
ncbi:G-protein alpha subunit-domain-containing protein [Tribonema minus]|uniref:G-protein alpha subunit-domain-containing protein n=1 Tax=Tribonema minus TaxID=303371 RepID=A0A835YYG9_9STRA|nr:G-protein alpha subunit-domain-containing protein [Tribonema minus]